MMLDLDDINNETDAKAAAEELIKEAIDASEATRRKRNKIIACMAGIKRLMKWCRAKKWDVPVKQLKKQFHVLEEARGEDDVNIFGI